MQTTLFRRFALATCLAGAAFAFLPAASAQDASSSSVAAGESEMPMVGGAPIELEKTYGVVSNNYVRNGGDGYAPFTSAQNAYDYGPDLADVTAEFIAANGAYTPYTDGRITVK